MAGGILFGSQLVMAAAPTADFDFTPGVGRVGEPVSFSASVEDPDDDVVSVEWDFENDGTIDDAGENVQHTYSSSGTRTVRMVVTDATSDTAVVFDTIRVNAPPNAAFDLSPSNPTVGQTVELRRHRLHRRRGARPTAASTGTSTTTAPTTTGAGARSTTPSPRRAPRPWACA